MKYLLIALTALTMAACTPDKSAPPPSAGGGAAPAGEAPAKLTFVADKTIKLQFFDEGGFDFDLSKAMRERNRLIDVNVLAPFSLNNLPKRLERWFKELRDREGSVKAKKVDPDIMVSRGIVGILIDVVLSIFETSAEKALYGPSEYYDATLLYNEKKGAVTQILFTHKEQ